MHQKKISKFLRTFLEKYHSIPILLKKSSKSRHLRYVSYSIPLMCGLALLLVVIGNMAVGQGAYAAEVITCDPIDVEGYELNNSCEAVPILTTPTVRQPSLTLSIDGSESGVSDRVVVGYGKSSYSSHTVSVRASSIKNYSIVMSGSELTGPSNISNTTDRKCSELLENTWGYGWEETIVSDNNAICKAVSSDVTLEGAAVSNAAVDFSKKLVFAVKFGEDANPGMYNAKVNLSVVATPLDVVEYVGWGNMVYMQDMSKGTCDSVSVGATATLTDIRDNSAYTVGKLADGKCWMTQNLRLTGDSMKSGLEKTITSYDSDVNEDFVVPVSLQDPLSGFTGHNTRAVYYGDNLDYGAYYAWYTATAGTGTYAMTSGEAESSVCPKDWRLPTVAEYVLLYEVGKSGWVPNNGKYGYWLGASSATGGAFFPAAGQYKEDVYSGGGYYWTSTANGISSAHLLFFNAGLLDTTYDGKQAGRSVRCVVK